MEALSVKDFFLIGTDALRAPPDEAERRATQLAEAESIANSAGELRAGVAKVCSF